MQPCTITTHFSVCTDANFTRVRAGPRDHNVFQICLTPAHSPYRNWEEISQNSYSGCDALCSFLVYSFHGKTTSATSKLISWPSSQGSQPSVWKNTVLLWCNVDTNIYPLTKLKLREGGGPVRGHKTVLNRLEGLDEIYLKALKSALWLHIFFIALGKLKKGDWKLHDHMHLMLKRS